MLSQVQLSCFLFSYLVAFGGEIFQLLRSKSTVTRWLLVGFGTGGLIAHTAYLFNRSSESGLPPLVGSSHDWLLVLAWMGGFLYLVAVGTNQKLAVGLFLLPVMLGLIVMALFVDDASLDSTREVAAHRWGMLHAATLVLGMGAVAAATICAMMYLLQYRKLRGRAGALQNLQLPSLETLTTLTQWLVVGTVALLTIGLVTGFILAGIHNEDASGSFSWTDPIVVGTTIVWGIMIAAVCKLLTNKEQSGRQIARLTFLAGGFLLFTIFGLMLLSGGVHDRRPAESGSDDSAQHDSRHNIHPGSDHACEPKALAQWHQLRSGSRQRFVALIENTPDFDQPQGASPGFWGVSAPRTGLAPCG